jgi:three-Cys-motif partner protein
MGELVPGDDGFDVEEVGPWAKDKIASLCRYITISSAARRKWLGPGKAGATYVELFCGPGRSKIRRRNEFIDGSCVAAWNESVRAGAPFSSVFVADADSNRRELAVERLMHAGAPVVSVEGDAVTAARTIRGLMRPSSLHFVFVDPYNLGAFKFEVMETFAGLSYVDMLVHISKMDIQRNTGMNIRAQRAAFDDFAPGWRSSVDLSQRHPTVRREMFNFWRRKVAMLGISASTDMELITNEGGQHLYWLTLLAKHDLALRFWKAAANKTGRHELKL